MRRPLLLAALAIALLGVAGPARAEIYHWTDAGGTPHFSDRPEDVPPQYRQQLPEELRSKARVAQQPSESEAKPGLLSRALSAAHPAPQPQRQKTHRSDFSKLAALRHLGVGTALLLFLGTLAFSFFFYAFLIRLACRICGEEIPGYGRALGVVMVQMLAGIGLGILELAVLGATGAGRSPLAAGFNTLASLAVNVAVLRSMLGQSLGKALAVQLVTILLSIAIGVVLVLALLFGLGGMAALHGAG